MLNASQIPLIVHDGLIVIAVVVVDPRPAAPALGESLLPTRSIQEGQFAPVVAELGAARVLDGGECR